ncbi:MAG: energy-coupling factor transporter transmembrane protein EcfT [Myxococcales bacterium]|nr:MAG: energy-coupling factor transporter transmembrane protein EcfT [Myxococcales bacterium]
MQYRPRQTALHRLHPLTKLLWLVWTTVVVVFCDSIVLSLVCAVYAVVFLWWAGARPLCGRGLGLWLFLGLAVFTTHALFVHTGVPVIGPITDTGLHSGLLVVGRLMTVILMSAVFVITTEPFSMASALMQVGLPYRWGFALVAALRMAAVLRVEVHHVYRAQLVRGVAYDAAPLRRWWLLIRHLCLPLLVSSLRAACLLSQSMEGRGFGSHRRRTYMREIPTSRCDATALVLLVVFTIALLWYGVTRVRVGGAL